MAPLLFLEYRMDQEQARELKQAVIALLARREYSFKELQRKFSQKYSADLIERVLEQLIADGYQSDIRYAESFTRNRIIQRYGIMRIKQELQQKGISRDLLEQVLEAQDVDWYQLVCEAWQKKFNLPPEAGDQKMYAKQMRFLLQRGFDMDQARYAIEQAKEELKALD